MCTLILGVDLPGPGSVLLAANRDEDPGRPSDPPGVLRAAPRLVGGRDRLAGGTWLAVREGRAVVAILNRRDRSGGPSPSVPGRRSRGTLVMEVAAAAEDAAPSRPLPDVALRRATAVFEPGRYAPCTLVFASPEESWLMANDAEGPPRHHTIGPGWHVLTHGDLDDPDEPRTVWLTRELAGFAPSTLAEAEDRLDGLLRSHGDASAGVPAVCLHQGRMVTVSTSSVWLSRDGARYRHAEGHPCEHPLADRSDLLRAGSGAGRP